MLQFFGNALISFIEQELIKHEPEIEALVMSQLKGLTDMFMSFIASKDESEEKVEQLEHKK